MSIQRKTHIYVVAEQDVELSLLGMGEDVILLEADDWVLSAEAGYALTLRSEPTEPPKPESRLSKWLHALHLS